MNVEEKKKIAFRMTVRASGAIQFVEDYLAPCLDSVDRAYLRPLYILLSFAFELILKSRVVMLSDASDVNKLNSELKNYFHDFAKIATKLGSNELNRIGIKNVILNKTSNNYVVNTTDDKKLYVEDFNDIRYDFMTNRMRVISADEHRKIQEGIEIMMEIKTLTVKVNTAGSHS